MTHSVCSHNATLSFALFAVAIFLFAGTAAAKRNDDTITMKNGDRFTGEIKKLDHGILYFKSSYMLESVQLDWAQVDTLQSKDPLQPSLAFKANQCRAFNRSPRTTANGICARITGKAGIATAAANV
jgi:hypothetical protein